MTHSHHKIMIVDDDAGMLFTLTGILEDEGFDVKGASDGYKAIRLAKEHSFDLIFMDMKMPGINGVEVCRELLKSVPPPVVVMMTGYSVAELMREALDEGVYTILHKPFEVENVIGIIHNVLSSTHNPENAAEGGFPTGPMPGPSNGPPPTNQGDWQ